MMKLKIAKTFKCECKKCKTILNTIEKFSLPDESYDWDCETCGDTFHVYVYHEDSTRINVKINECSRVEFKFNNETNIFERC